MKKFLCVLLALATLLSLAACGNGGTAQNDDPTANDGDPTNDPAVTLVYAEVNPLDTIVGMTASEFKAQVEKLSGGTITIDIQHSGVLGSENDVLDN